MSEGTVNIPESEFRRLLDEKESLRLRLESATKMLVEAQQKLSEIRGLVALPTYIPTISVADPSARWPVSYGALLVSSSITSLT